MGRKARGNVDEAEPLPGDGANESGEGNGVSAGAVPGGPVESKADKFRRLATHRMPKVLKAMKAVRNLANKAGYEWSEDAAAKIVSTLQKEVDTLKAQFQGAKDAPAVWTL